MCGIYGSIGNNYQNIGKKFSYYLNHRGPDDSGIFFDHNNNIVLGHTRLSIIDLTTHANQPMIDDEKDYAIVFNGQIYNFFDIRLELISLGYKFKTKSDTEVLLKSFVHWNDKSILKFRGMFSFCIYNKKNKSLFLARDRFGIKPLIYTFLDDQFIFSSELKPILNTNFISKKISEDAVSEYFQYGSIKQPNTILKGVYQLLPSHCMTVKFDKNFEIIKYYDYTKESKQLPIIESYNEAVIKVRDELEIATKHHLVSDVEVGAFLSGGVDSNAVVALMKLCGSKQLNTFCVGFRDKTNIEDETDIASRSAKKLGCNHHNIMIDGHYIERIFDDFIQSIDQPSFDGLNTFIVSKETAKKVKVALSGLGGDELFAGYSHFKNISKYSKKKQNLKSFILQKLNSLRPNRLTNKYEFFGKNEESSLNTQRSIVRDLKNILLYPSKNSFLDEENNLTSYQKISKSEIDNYMLNTLLRDTDILSMSNSLEVRPILLDHKLVELVFGLKDSFKFYNGVPKSLLIDSIKDLIPKETYMRKKTGFELPFSEWMNTILNKKFIQVMNNSRIHFMFNKTYTKNLLRRIKYKKCNRLDWLTFIFVSWLDRHSNNLNLK
jgi:asparagine synthase (glutamine-hydrolysing)